MLHVLQRMAVWAKNFKVAQVVILSVSVFMVHTQNFWLQTVTTPFARHKKISFYHVFSHSSKIGPPNFFCGFIYASSRTIFSFVRWRVQKFAAAMQTGVLYSTFAAHCFMKAFWRAIFSFIGSTSNMRKNCAAFSAICGNFNSCVQRHTFSAAILRSIFSIFRHCKASFTMQTVFFVPNSGASYATH